MSAAEIQKVQHIVNQTIRENLIVNTDQMGYKQAVAEGATALFDENTETSCGHQDRYACDQRELCGAPTRLHRPDRLFPNRG